MSRKLAIISTHPIQYYAPVFKLLAKKVDLLVFYSWGKNSLNKYDDGFKQKVEWDLPILEGYKYVFLENTSKNQGSHHFNGVNNPTIIKEIENFKPDAVLIYGWAWRSHLKAIRFFKGKIPIYFRGDSTLLSKSKGLKGFLKTLFLKWVYANVDFAFFVGTANKVYFKKYGVKEDQLIFAPHAIDNQRFAENRVHEADQIREKLGIKKEELIILFAGKFEVLKNPMLLLDAFIELTLVKVHLLFVGNGKLEESLKLKVEKLKVSGALQQAQDDIEVQSSRFKVQSLAFIPPPPSSTSGYSKSLKERIHFMDFQNQTQMPAIYQACDLFCLPSKSETWGLSVNEAMAAGKAILVSDQVGCAVDLVKPKINGEVFKSEDLQDLKCKLLSLVADKNKLNEFGKSSQAIIQDWSFEKQVDSFLGTHNF